MQRSFTLGARGSELALIQAEMVQAGLAEAHDLDDIGVTKHLRIRPMSTTGDRIQDKALREFGGKGLFTKEIEEALLNERIDMAVHSMKDMPTVLPEGLEICCVLPREDPRDAFLSPKADRLEDLPEGAVLGASSLRRRAQALSLRPDLKMVEIRGNVNTRLRKLADGEADATFLALAGLKRMGREGQATRLIPTTEMLPALAQGVVGIEIRSDDEDARAALAKIHCKDTAIRLAAERAFLAGLDGSCRTPIAGLAELEGGVLTFRGEVYAADGTDRHGIDRETKLGGKPEEEAAALGSDAAAALREKAGAAFMESFTA